MSYLFFVPLSIILFRVSHTLRSRTVESSQRDDVATSQEGECDWPHDQPEELDELGVDETTRLSPAEASQTMDSEAQMTEATKITTGKVYIEECNVNNISELKTMIASLFAKLDTSTRELRESHKELKENLQDKLDTNSKDLKDLQNKLDTNSKNLKNLQNKLDTTNKELKESLENKIDTTSKESKRDFKALEDKLETSYREMKESNDKFQKEIETKFE
jgi:chromosome segregation ATPase